VGGRGWNGLGGEQAKALTWFHPWHSVFDADYEEVDPTGCARATGSASQSENRFSLRRTSGDADPGAEEVGGFRG
jgi:hypothetical protein